MVILFQGIFKALFLFKIQLGVYCLDCVLPMNFTNGKLPDSAFTAKSYKTGHPAHEARFSGNLWCGMTKEDATWLQVDLGKV